MQRVNLKIHREQKKTFYQPDTLYHLFRGNGGTRGTIPDTTQKICIPVCTLFLKMYPVLYPRRTQKNVLTLRLYLMLPLLCGRKEIQR